MIDCYENCKDLRNGVCPPMKMFCPKNLAGHDRELLDKFVTRLKEYFVIPHDVYVIEQMAKELKAEVSQ